MSFYPEGFQPTNVKAHEDLFNPDDFMTLDETNRALTLLDADKGIMATNAYSLDENGKYMIQAYLSGIAVMDGRQSNAAYVSLGSFESVEKLLTRLK